MDEPTNYLDVETVDALGKVPTLDVVTRCHQCMHGLSQCFLVGLSVS